MSAPANPRDLPPKLVQLARLYGVQLAYHDGVGRRRYASAAAVEAVLRALGAELGEAGEPRSRAEAALRARRAELAHRRLDPVALAWGGEGAADLLLPAELGERSLACELALDPTAGGEVDRRRWTAPIADLAVTATARIEGRRYLTVRLPLTGAGRPSGRLPYGRHRLTVEVSGGGAGGSSGGGGERGPWTATVISAPPRLASPSPNPPSSTATDAAGPGRPWGVFLPLYSLATEHSRGIGDFGDLGALRDWAEERGASAVATLPLFAAFLDQPYDPSPYAPVSRLFWNELYVDLDRLPGIGDGGAAAQRLAGGDLSRAVAGLAAGELVEPDRQWALRRPILRAAAEEAFADLGDALRRELDDLRRRLPDLDRYAAFRAVCDRRRCGWPSWPAALRDLGGGVARGGGTIVPREYDPRDADLYRYAQWAADRQLTAAAGGEGGCGLLLDLPLGVHGAGYDRWAYPELFAEGISAGAPPDPLCPAGQDWGFAPLHPERQRQAGYGYFARTLRRLMAKASVLRIDHVMQLHRLFWVPAGMGADEGVYVRYPAEELYAVLCAEAAGWGGTVVGENLGTVPGSVDAALERRGLLGTWVLQHELDPRSPAGYRPVPERTLASPGTHDMPPLAAVRRQPERADAIDALISRLAAAGLLPAAEEEPGDAELAAAVLESLGTSRAAWVLAPLEDLWGERRPQNVPGTPAGMGDERPNWRRRARLTLEGMREDPRVVAALARLDRARRAPAAADRPAPRGLGSLGSLSADDGYLFAEGRHFRLFEKLGAHPVRIAGRSGTRFAVWAPNARRVSVIGDFNGWDREADPLAPVPAGDGGLLPAEPLDDGDGRPAVWEGFVPGAGPGQRYKFHVESRVEGHRADKADPFAFCSETPPDTASVIWDLGYSWGDGEWMATRGEHAAAGRPVSIYEVHLGSWRRVPEAGDRSLSYRELAPALAEHVRRLGFTHVELLPVMEHPFYGSWGYQTTGYFAPTRRHGDPQELMALIDHLHRAGIGVILDWVPSHFPDDVHGLGFFDGTRLFEYADPREGRHPDWKSLIFDYSRGEVRSFLVSSAIFWLERYHADGLRVDAVASMLHRDYSRGDGDWVPNVDGGRENLEAIELLRQLNDEIHRTQPGAVTFAEESTAWPGVTRPTGEGGLGFDYKWDLGWMNDTLSHLERDPVHRKHHWEELTFRAVYAFSERYCLPLSHDEVVHGKRSLKAKMFGDDWQQRAQLRMLYGYQWTQPGKKLLFMGGELGSDREWSHDSSLDWHLLEGADGLVRWLADLNRVYRQQPSLWRRDDQPATFRWSVVDDAETGVLAYVRRGAAGDPPLLALFNLTPRVRYEYAAGVPTAGRWREVLNSDAAEYGGGGVGNQGAVEARAVGGDGGDGGGGDGQAAWPAVAGLTVPPLAMVLLAGPAAG